MHTFNNHPTSPPTNSASTGARNVMPNAAHLACTLFSSCPAVPYPASSCSTSPHTRSASRTIMLVTSVMSVGSGNNPKKERGKGLGHTSTHTRENVRQRSRARARGGEKERRRLTPGPRQGLPSWPFARTTQVESSCLQPQSLQQMLQLFTSIIADSTVDIGIANSGTCSILSSARAPSAHNNNWPQARFWRRIDARPSVV
jgi:hypothetical protein